MRQGGGVDPAIAAFGTARGVLLVVADVELEAKDPRLPPERGGRNGDRLLGIAFGAGCRKMMPMDPGGTAIALDLLVAAF